MKIKKYWIQGIITLAFLALLITSCEKDDSCIDPTTPNLVIEFYDYNDSENLKSIDNLSIIYLLTGDTIEYENTDRVEIPLNVNDDLCSFKFIKDTEADIVLFNYQRENVFVSKACGYKTLFHNLSVNIENIDYWIKDIEIINQEIVNDTSAHVKIFH